MSINKFNILKFNHHKNRNISLILGVLFFSVGIIDFYLNNYFNTNITSFLPRIINFFTPLIFGVIGLHLIRIEFSGIKILDSLNKNINTTNFNAALSVSIILLIIFGLPPLLNWLILDANFAGDTKEAPRARLTESPTSDVGPVVVRVAKVDLRLHLDQRAPHALHDEHKLPQHANTVRLVAFLFALKA